MVKHGNGAVRLSGAVSVQVSATMAVMAFNSGEEELEKIQQKFGLRSSRATLEHAANKTEKRLKRSLKPSETRKLKQWKQVKLQKKRTQREGLTYGAREFFKFIMGMQASRLRDVNSPTLHSSGSPVGKV